MKIAPITAVLALVAMPALAIDVVDQQNTGPIGGGFTISASPIGQSFVPTQGTLDFVELQINDQNPEFGTAVDIAVRIRANDIAGAVLGTSNTVSFADQVNTIPSQGFQQVELVRFDFASSVTLTPGSTYVLEPFKIGGISDLGIFGTGFGIDAYAPGLSYFQGAPFSGPDAPFDLWFREGSVAVVPEPSSWALMTLVLLGVAARARRRH